MIYLPLTFARRTIRLDESKLVTLQVLLLCLIFRGARAAAGGLANRALRGRGGYNIVLLTLRVMLLRNWCQVSLVLLVIGFMNDMESGKIG